MKAEVVSCDECAAVLHAPLAPNINHRNTVFGGSAASLALLSGWTLLHARLVAGGQHPRLVIQENSMHYWRPLESAFTASGTAVGRADAASPAPNAASASCSSRAS